MAEGSGEIIIKGGSAEIEFDPALFEQDPNNPKKYKQKDKDLKITHVTIEDGDKHIGNHASGPHPDGFKGTIRVRFKFEK